MSTPLHVTIPHQLGRAEARRRIEHGVSKLADQLPGDASVYDPHWEGDRLAFRIAALGQAVSGCVEVLEASVAIEIELPGLLGQIAGTFKDKLKKAGQLLLTRN